MSGLRMNVEEFNAAVRALTDMLTTARPAEKHENARLAVGFRAAVTMLGWFAGLRTIGPDDIRAGRALYTFVSGRMEHERRKSLMQAFERIARGWAPQCPACGRRMVQMTDPKGKEVPGCWSCACGAWFGKDMDTESRPVTPRRLWIIDRSWQKKIARKKSHRGKSGRRRRRQPRRIEPGGASFEEV